MSGCPLLDNITIVLVRPRISQNIGACCRAMHNLGLKRLIVTAPARFDLPDIERMATHAALSVVGNLQIKDTLADALAPFTFIAGTTARMGKQRQMIYSPEQIAQKIVSLVPSNEVAVLFGPEDRGLGNDDLKYCHSLVNIPTAEFSSLNLAQAVMILCYELFLAAHPRKDEPFQPRMATSHELEGMYAHLKEMLLNIDFIDRDNPDYWMNNFRRFFARVGLTAKEVRLIRGVCRQVKWYGGKRHADGLAEKKQSPPPDID
jgi:tRNA/rRNA methyltransferase